MKLPAGIAYPGLSTYCRRRCSVVTLYLTGSVFPGIPDEICEGINPHCHMFLTV